MPAPLPHLETFALAAEAGSFTAAARELGLTQAAVSQRIAALERELGVPLFTRQSGRVQLTPCGLRLHELAREVLALHDRAREEITGRPAPVYGELAIAASSTPGEHLLPGLLPRFGCRHPHVQLRVTVTDSQQVFRQVEQGAAHLGLAGDRPDSPHLHHERFAGDALVLVVPPGHGWAGREAVGVGELRGLPLIVREPGSGSRHRLEQALAGAGVSLGGLGQALELGSNEAIREAVRQGAGVAFLSNLVVAEDARAGRLHALAVEGLDLMRDLYALYDRRRPLTIPARLFLDVLKTGP